MIIESETMRNKKKENNMIGWGIFLIISIMLDVILMCDIGFFPTVIIMSISMLAILGMSVLEEKQNGKRTFGIEETMFFITILIVVIKVIRSI